MRFRLSRLSSQNQSRFAARARASRWRAGSGRSRSRAVHWRRSSPQPIGDRAAGRLGDRPEDVDMGSYSRTCFRAKHAVTADQIRSRHDGYVSVWLPVVNARPHSGKLAPAQRGKPSGPVQSCFAVRTPVAVGVSRDPAAPDPRRRCLLRPRPARRDCLCELVLRSPRRREWRGRSQGRRWSTELPPAGACHAPAVTRPEQRGALRARRARAAGRRWACRPMARA